MSLFPAYSNTTISECPVAVKPDDNKNEEASSSWLTNSSFRPTVTTSKLLVDISSSESSADESVNKLSYGKDDVSCIITEVSTTKKHTDEKSKSKHPRKRKKEKRKRDKEGIKDNYEKDVENLYFEDRHRDRGNSTVNTLCSRARPYYNVGQLHLGFTRVKVPKKESYQRYHVKNIDALVKMCKKNTVIKRGAAKKTADKAEDELASWCINIEEERTNKTREYNEKLANEPNDIRLWIEYIEFQDTLAEFQKHQVITEDLRRATLTKKLSITEKALEKNPDSKQLIRLKLRLMEELAPGDQFSNDMETLVHKDSGNIILWKTFIMTTQGSVAMCNVPRVLDLYSKCFSILRQKSRTNPRIYDDILLEMLHQCLIFLRHTGLWEQMWETIRLNLTLNLSLNRDSLSLRGSIDEKKLISMEEVILMSRLPLNQLWLRTESLREHCHWITVSREELELVGDSRRFILPEDVADFVHPIVSPNSNYRMAIYSLLALKVPFLPTRDYMMKDLALKEFEWSAESAEILLPFAFPGICMLAGQSERKEILKGILEGRLTSGPQYIQFHPAQEPYTDFIREIFRTIAEQLPPLQKTSIYIWWLRFEQLLLFLGKNDPLRHDNKSKKVKTALKEFLKKDENRNNLHFYKEYALIEREMGKFDSCVNILETAIQSQNVEPASISSLEERAAVFNMYRTIMEVLLDADTYKKTHRQRIETIFEHMVPDKTLSITAEGYLEKCVQTFLQEALVEDEQCALFLPNLECDIIVCYAYLLYVKYSDIFRAIAVFKKCIEHTKNTPKLQEMLYESTVSLLQLYYQQSQESPDLLKETLRDALILYPDNFCMLSVFVNIESESPCWKLTNIGTEIHLWRMIALCLASRRRIRSLMKVNHTDAANATVNKLLSLHRKLARIPETRCCPLIWRLYMLLLREHNLCEKKGEQVYHESVAQCPWVRSVYIDAAEVAPQLLTQIQDVIKEKELRMHVTPEELDILRG